MYDKGLGEMDANMLKKTAIERMAGAGTPQARAERILSQMKWFPGIASDEGWLAVLEAMIAERDQLAEKIDELNAKL